MLISHMTLVVEKGAYCGLLTNESWHKLDNDSASLVVWVY
jgi:hypothetical protein